MVFRSLSRNDPSLAIGGGGFYRMGTNICRTFRLCALPPNCRLAIRGALRGRVLRSQSLLLADHLYAQRLRGASGHCDFSASDVGDAATDWLATGRKRPAIPQNSFLRDAVFRDLAVQCAGVSHCDL